MHQTIKNALGASLIIVILVASFGIISYTRSYKLSQPRKFTVTAEGEAVAVPDVARFSVGIITEGGKDLSRLQQTNTEKGNRIISFLKKEGIDQKDIKTENYSIYPRYESVSCPITSFEVRVCPPAEIVGYNINQNIAVKVRDFKKIGALLSGVVDAGANTVSQLSFTIDDPEQVENEARQQAVEKAQAKARSIARNAGFGLGRLLSIQESGQPPFLPFRSFALEKADSAPIIEPGSEEIKISVTLEYEIR